MATVNLHTGIVTSPKFAPLTDGALRLWLNGLCWSKEHLTDGYIPMDMLASLHRHAVRLVAELLAVRVPGKGPLWHKEATGYRIHDFTHWQDSADVVQMRRLKWRDQKRGAKPSARTPESAPASTVESTPESARESKTDSRHGGGCGGGVGGGRGKQHPPTPTGELFDRFWNTYPNGADKVAARNAWAKLNPDEALVATMLAAIAWQAATDQWQRGIIPHASTWLNRRRWEDEPTGRTAGAVSTSVAVVDPDYHGAEYRFHCAHTPTCASWPQHRELLNGAATAVSA